MFVCCHTLPLDSKSSHVTEIGSWSISEHRSPMVIGVCFTFYTAPARSCVLPQMVALMFISIIKVKSKIPMTTKKARLSLALRKTTGEDRLVEAGGLSWKQAYFLDLMEWESSVVAWVSAPPVGSGAEQSPSRRVPLRVWQSWFSVNVVVSDEYFSSTCI